MYIFISKWLYRDNAFCVLNIKIKDAIIAPFFILRGRHHASSAALSLLSDVALPIPFSSVIHAARHAVRLCLLHG